MPAVNNEVTSCVADNSRCVIKSAQTTRSEAIQGREEAPSPTSRSAVEAAYAAGKTR
jgi:hypothetical protein